MKKDEDCSEEYLLISDGVGGELKVCGKVNFDKPLLASDGARDIFMVYKAGETKPAKPFTCEATCSTTKSIDKLLRPRVPDYIDHLSFNHLFG